jgi:centriolar protein POC1
MARSSAHLAMLQVWSVPRRNFLCSLVGHNNWVRCCAVSPDERLAMSGGDDHAARLWDLEARVAVQTFKQEGGSVRSVCFHPEGL